MKRLEKDILQQIKDWLNESHSVSQETCDAIGLLWAAHDEIKALRNRRPAENEALTVDVLEAMTGKPVWAAGLNLYCLVFKDKYGYALTDFAGRTYPVKEDNGPYYRHKPEQGG